MFAKGRFIFCAATLLVFAACSKDGVGPTDVDVCPNIGGPQPTVPSGMVKNSAGQCVTNVVLPKPFEVVLVSPSTQSIAPTGLVTLVKLEAKVLFDGKEMPNASVEWKVDGVVMAGNSLTFTVSALENSTHTAVATSTSPETGEAKSASVTFAVGEGSPIHVHIWTYDGKPCTGWKLLVTKNGMIPETVDIPSSSTSDCNFSYRGTSYKYQDSVAVVAQSSDYVWQAIFMVNRPDGSLTYPVNHMYEAEIKFLAAPRNPTVPSGLYAGQKFSTDFDWAYKLNQGVDYNWTSFLPQAVAPGQIFYDQELKFPKSSWPVKVAYDYADSDLPFDSVTAWQAFRQFENEMGLPSGTLIPAKMSDLQVVGGRYKGLVVLGLKSSFTEAGCPSKIVADACITLSSGVVGSELKRAIRHESGHILGLGHDDSGLMSGLVAWDGAATLSESGHFQLYRGLKEKAAELGFGASYADGVMSSNARGWLYMRGAVSWYK